MTVTTSSTASTYVDGLKIPNRFDGFGTYCSDTIRWHRIKQGLSKHELAKKAGVSHMFIVRAEKYKWQSLRNMFKVFRALGLEFDIRFEAIGKETQA